MNPIYTVILVILGILAVSGLFVGVMNDAANFLNSAIGSKAAPKRFIMAVASCGIIVGAVTSSGMMEVARSAMFDPAHYYVQVVDYISEVAKALMHITRPCFDHIDNNHEGMTKDQIEDLMHINDEVEAIYGQINRMLQTNDFSQIDVVLEKRDHLFETIAEVIKHQLLRIKERQTSTRSSMLFLTILNETKTMVLQSRNLLKSQRYFIDHRPDAKV